MDLLHRSAAVAPATLDPEARTVEVIFSTGARVLRGGMWTEGFIEELSLDAKHVRLGRLQSGSAPVLNSHSAADVDDVVGVVESARLERRQGIARLRFAADDPKAESVWNKVRQGILRNVSVGYRVHTFEETGATDSKLPVRKAVDWEPYEISIVPMGADAGAVVRSQERHMDPEVTNPIEAERQRAADISSQCRAGGVPDLAERFIADGLTTEQVAVRVLDALRARAQDHLGPRVGGSRVRVSEPGLDALEFRTAAADALCVRAAVAPATVHPAAQDLPGSVLELARLVCSRHGIATTAFGADRLLRSAMTTSDFPLILTDAMHKALRRGFEEEPASHREWVRVTTVPDFRLQHRPILGSAPSLEEVLEHGEYTQGAMDEDSTSYRVAKFGRIVSLTWETLVNDDLSAFLRVQPALGQAARRKEADLVYALFAENAGAGPTMQDTNPLFDQTNHGNVTDSMTALDPDALSAGRVLLRRQTALGGGQLSLTPAFLIVAPEYEMTAENLLAAGTRVRVGSATQGFEAFRSEWIGRLQLVVESRLDDSAVYLATSPTQIDTVELGLLEANADGPTFTQETSFLVDQTSYKIRHVAGVKALDWRGLVKIPISAS